jgi:hypothetical protein
MTKKMIPTSGYRVPLNVSTFVKTHDYISTHVRSQAAIPNLIDNAFSLPSLGTDDSANVLNSAGARDALQDIARFHISQAGSDPQPAAVEHLLAASSPTC